MLKIRNILLWEDNLIYARTRATRLSKHNQYGKHIFSLNDVHVYIVIMYVSVPIQEP